MATDHLVRGSVMLAPLIVKTIPRVVITAPDFVEFLELDQAHRVNFEFRAPQGWLQVEFINKCYDECSADRDMAVIIKAVEFFNVTDQKFVWAGTYRPEYPEPWYSQQHPRPEPVLAGSNYLGWNGVWRLNFDLPVFSWMHKTLDMGWLHD